VTLRRSFGWIGEAPVRMRSSAIEYSMHTQLMSQTVRRDAARIAHAFGSTTTWGSAWWCQDRRSAMVEFQLEVPPRERTARSGSMQYSKLLSRLRIGMGTIWRRR